MTGLRRLHLLLTDDRAVLALLPEALWYLFIARIRLLFPFACTAPRLGRQSQETAGEVSARDAHTIKRITRAIRGGSRLTPWKSTCMVRAVAALGMLEKRGIESTLYMGLPGISRGR